MGLCCKSQEVVYGSDVSLRCEVSVLSETSILQWEKDGQQTSNTTLMYNNSAYIILHSVDKHNEGKYYCRLTEDGKVETVRIHMLNVTSHSYNGNNRNSHVIYKQSSNNSDVSLICKSKKDYHRLKWTWESRPKSQIDLVAVEKGKEVQVKGPIKPGRNTSTSYDGHFFIFHISPVNFSHSGTYRCITNDQNDNPYTATILRTIRVSVEPPNGVLRNQSVVLNCELSEVTDSVTLVWLRMEGNKGVLVKQQIMTEKNNNLQLTVNLSSYKTDLLHWQCAVFTENTLRALAPKTIILTSSTTNAPKDTMTKDSHLHIVISVACAVTISVLILLGLLVLKCQRKTDEGRIAGIKSQEDEDIHYTSVTVAGSSQGTDRWFKTKHASSEVLDRESAVIYSDVKTKFHAIEYPPVQTDQTQNEVLHGSDVSLRCDVPLLSESSTLHWEKDGEQTSNTTLMYNNSAYIILHTVDKRTEGKYYCRLLEDGRIETVRIHTLNVTQNSYSGKNKNRTIYRLSSSNSDILLICKSSSKYLNLKWTWEQRRNSQIDLIAFEKGIKVQLKGPIKPERHSSTTYNSRALIFHISPVNFNYSGTYRCITETGIYTTIILHTIRVSVESPDGVLRNQSVNLTCELSEGTDSVTLVWLRMEGNKGVLVKQQIMTEENNKLHVTVNLSSDETDILQWQCAVFTDNTLRALAAITNSLTSSTTNAPSTSAETVTKQGNKHEKHTLPCVLTLFIGILLGALLYYCYRKRKSMQSNPQESEPVYINISQMRNDRERSSTLGNRENSPKIYRNIRRNRYGKTLFIQ
ncbi:hypothetical protein Q8A67_006794 [Cirrhinus molitorella]|uniref:Ig-like domain-containing protein n=1 Tax=Cirrhinus molitorella TaxID=172907 RepID=A0AA88PUY3_9TELE|nr:hypothetical protein Q8A67_006794 [Cirrhinus molitorella]